jgi:transcriptional regulator with XRE-family HTH domain
MRYRKPPPPKEFARLLHQRMGMARGYASDLARGRRTPSLALAYRIRRELKISLDHWEQFVMGEDA